MARKLLHPCNRWLIAVRITGHDNFIDAAETFKFFRHTLAHGLMGIDIADNGDAFANSQRPDEVARTSIKGFLNADAFKGHVGGPSGFRIRPVTLYNLAYECIPIRHQVSPERACSLAFHWESVGHKSR